MKTHKVIDLAYTEEGQQCFSGTHLECVQFLEEQSSCGSTYTLEIVPLLKEELSFYNK